MNPQEVRLRKIPLDLLIQSLMDIYNSGVDYIDIIGKADVEQDTIGLAFCDEYLSENNEETEEEEETTDEELKEKIKNINLSDEDLNQLL
jgi:hypothetical protein